MARPQVTITLGRSGQRVVKESWGDFAGGRAVAPAPSGSRRSLAEFLESSADNSFSSNKRMREDLNAKSYGHSTHMDVSRIGARDLRSKLTRKRLSRRAELENEKLKNIELHEKVSKAIRSMESPDRSTVLRSIPSSSRGAVETPQMGSVRSSYTSWTPSGPRTLSPEIIPKFSGGITATRSAIDELSHVPSMRPMNVSRTEPLFMSDPLDSSRQRVLMPMPMPMPTTSLRPLDSGKLVSDLPAATSGLPGSLFQEHQPLTVGGLLYSLGLGKYHINFQAEEIDMVALKQMGELDLKELGIPMGPRKKILLALQALFKRPPTQPYRIVPQ